MSTDAELLRRVMRWSLVKPEAVCGGSNAQAINVFTDALADIRRLATALEAARADARAEEREACARVAEAEEVAFGSDEYATGQPDSSFGERFACRQIAAALRNRTPSPPAKEKKT